MNRRELILTATAALTLPVSAQAYAPLAYAPSDWREVRDADTRVILNFRASWSLTCQMKADILKQLVAVDPAYQALTFMEVDWDTFGPAEWTKRLKVTRNSTLVGMRGRREISRIENEPYEDSIKRFLDGVVDA